MRSLIERLPATLKLGVLATLVFTLFATATTAFAEAKSFGPCKVGNTAMQAETSFWSSAHHSQTRQYYSGCSLLTVKLRWWESGVNTGEQYYEGGPYTYWATLSYRSGAIYTARHVAVIDGTSISLVTFTSDNGSHSTAEWYCNGLPSGGTLCV
jgi:hypothetical protein